MFTIEQYTNQKLNELKEKFRYRETYDSERFEGNIVKKNGKKLISFSCNDYLGLSFNKKIISEISKAAEKYGSGAVASRLITGNNILYSQLEKQLCKLHKTEAATIFSSGYAANFGVIKTVMGQGDLIILDKLSHNCLLEGAFASGAETIRFKHNDYKNLEKILSENRKNFNNAIIVTESIFSMDGDRANLSKIRSLAEKYNAWILVDYAHDVEIFINQPKKQIFQNEIKIGTFSKSLAGLGGYVCGSESLIKYINSKVGNLIFSTALPPSVLAADLLALKIAMSKKSLAKKALENAKYFADILKLPTPESQIIPMIIGDTNKTIEISKKLEGRGVLVHPIKPPTVSENTSRLRFSFSANHTKKQIASLVKILKKCL